MVQVNNEKSCDLMTSFRLDIKVTADFEPGFPKLTKLRSIART